MLSHFCSVWAERYTHYENFILSVSASSINITDAAGSTETVSST
jgi:hypothetical protein